MKERNGEGEKEKEGRSESIRDEWREWGVESGERRARSM